MLRTITLAFQHKIQPLEVTDQRIGLIRHLCREWRGESPRHFTGDCTVHSRNQENSHGRVRPRHSCTTASAYSQRRETLTKFICRLEASGALDSIPKRYLLSDPRRILASIRTWILWRQQRLKRTIAAFPVTSILQNVSSLNNLWSGALAEPYREAFTQAAGPVTAEVSH